MDKAKGNYFKNLLNANRKEPKKFWKTIKSVIAKDESDNKNIRFIDPETGMEIQNEQACNFMNSYFATVSDRVCNPADSLDYIEGEIFEGTFNFLPPERYEIMRYAEEIDENSSSGIFGLNSKICKIVLLHIPEKMRMMFANSMFSGIFPVEWAVSTVKLLPKSGNLSHPGNWRPISMTNIFSKILEKLVHRQVLKYFIDNNIIYENQYGFLPGKSTHEAIFKIVHQIYSAINIKKLMGMLLLDVAKAFNCLDHEILFKKMKNVGFSKNVICWFKSYLNRSQRVRMQNKLSDILPVNNGIAQGTVLGPILFIFYINDIFKCTNYVKMSLFADDCIMFLSGNNWMSVCRKMQHDLDAVVDWTFRNNLRLNHSKTKAMVFSTRNRLSTISKDVLFSMNGYGIEFVRNYSYLGIVLDETMSLIPLLKDIKKRISNRIFMFRKIRKFLTFASAVLVYKQTILPIIDYAGFLLVACRKEDKNELQKMQNDILRICNKSRVSDRVSIPTLHAKCKILDLEQRMRKQLLWLMYVLSRDNSFLRVPNRITRSAGKIGFKLPTKITPVYERSPFFTGAKLWDELPAFVQELPDRFAFKREIDRINRVYVKL